MNITTPTQTQINAVPRIFQAGISETSKLILNAKVGSGKTLTYLLGVQQYSKNALIIVPNSHLAEQVIAMASPLDIKCTQLEAGQKYKGNLLSESDELNVLIATPGVLSSFDNIRAILEPMDTVVLDEVDFLMASYVDQCREIFRLLRDKRALFVGATIPSRGPESAGGRIEHCFKTVQWIHTPDTHCAPDQVQNEFLPYKSEEDRNKLIFDTLDKFSDKKIIIFCSTTEVGKILKSAISSHLKSERELLHLYSRSERSVQQNILKRFNACADAVMVTTDLGARGIDFTNIDVVLQADFATNASTFIHRVGRAGRGILDPSRKFYAVSLFSPEHKLALSIKEAVEQGEPLESTFSRRRGFRNRLRKQLKRESMIKEDESSTKTDQSHGLFSPV